PPLAFRPPEIPAHVPKEVTAPLLWIAALLFLLDVAVRRVIIGREGFDKALAAVRGIFRPVAIPQTTHIGGLAAAKKSAMPQPPSRVPQRPSVPGSGVPNTNVPPPMAGSMPASPGIPQRPVIKPSAPPRTNPDAPAPGPAAAPPVAGNLAGSLLDRVKKNQPKK